jgi:hypothetical protein
VKLTRLAGAACIEGTPVTPATGSWTLAAPMPKAASEVATASLDGMTYVAAGYGDTGGFKRFDPARGLWTTLAELPGTRNHALAVGLRGSIYVVGGCHDGGSDVTGWRYDLAADRWTDVPALPDVVASGAAALNGLAYFGNIPGDLHVFDPRTATTREIPGDNRAPRDHSQVVAFQGEIWLIGGRDLFGETTLVSVFDPASETWRPGPALIRRRGGFAAAASSTHLIVAGGELVSVGHGTLATAEAISAGQGEWSLLPSMPTAVHGVGGAIHGNAFYALGGSTVAGIAASTTIVQVYRWAP